MLCWLIRSTSQCRRASSSSMTQIYDSMRPSNASLGPSGTVWVCLGVFWVYLSEQANQAQGFFGETKSPAPLPLCLCLCLCLCARDDDDDDDDVVAIRPSCKICKSAVIINEQRVIYFAAAMEYLQLATYLHTYLLHPPWLSSPYTYIHTYLLVCTSIHTVGCGGGP